jgi:ABC-type uncharacterized transport system auxiliary subunit
MKPIKNKAVAKVTLILSCLLVLSACNPTVRVEAPSEPIRIEANITIKHEIRIIVEKEVEEIFDDEEGLF